jgi:hypothetical protein
MPAVGIWGTKDVWDASDIQTIKPCSLREEDVVFRMNILLPVILELPEFLIGNHLSGQQGYVVVFVN